MIKYCNIFHSICRVDDFENCHSCANFKNHQDCNNSKNHLWYRMRYIVIYYHLQNRVQRIGIKFWVNIIQLINLKKGHDFNACQSLYMHVLRLECHGCLHILILLCNARLECVTKIPLRYVSRHKTVGFSTYSK